MYIRKIIFLYCIYWLLLLLFNLLDFMHGGYYLTQKGERVHVRIFYIHLRILICILYYVYPLS
jgi:hypothetical protein